MCTRFNNQIHRREAIPKGEQGKDRGFIHTRCEIPWLLLLCEQGQMPTHRTPEIQGKDEIGNARQIHWRMSKNYYVNTAISTLNLKKAGYLCLMDSYHEWNPKQEPPYAERHVRWCERSENESRKKTASFSSYSILGSLFPYRTI